MRQFKIYGVSSAVIVTIIILGLIFFIITNDAVVLLTIYLAAFLGLVVISAITPRFYRHMSETVELRDTAISSRKTEIAGLICHDCKSALATIEKVSSDVDTSSAKAEIERLGQELASMKCCSSSFEVVPAELSNVDLTFLTTRTAEVRDRLGAVKRSLADKYGPVVEKRGTERDASMKALLSSGYSIRELYSKFEGVLSRSPKDLDELSEKDEELASLAREALSVCLNEAKRIAGEEAGRKGAQEITSALAKVGTRNGDFLESAKELSETRKKLQLMMGGDFFTARDALASSINDARLAAKGDLLAGFRDKLSEMASSTRALADPGQLGSLKEREKAYRELVKQSFAELSQKTDEMLTELSDYKPPKEMLPKMPQKLEAPQGSLSEFTKRLVSLLKEASPGAEELSRNVRIMRSYPKAERLIDARLAEGKKVQARDLDIRHPETFFMLYKKKHPKVKFIESPEPKLFEE